MAQAMKKESSAKWVKNYLKREVSIEHLEALYKTVDDPWFYWERFREHYHDKVVLPVLAASGLDKKKATMIDVGCGVAAMGDAFLRATKKLHYTGFDISEAACNKARENLKPYGQRVHIQQGDFLKNGYENEQFDLVVALNSQYYHPSKKKKLAFDMQLCRITRRFLLVGASDGYDYHQLTEPLRLYTNGICSELARFQIENLTDTDPRNKRGPNKLISFILYKIEW